MEVDFRITFELNFGASPHSFVYFKDKSAYLKMFNLKK